MSKQNVGNMSPGESKAVVLKALNDAGYNDNEASKLMGITRQYVHAIQGKIKKGTLDPLRHKAKKSIKDLVQGKAVGDMTEVKGSDVIQAAKMILDRTDPVIQKVEQTTTRINYDLSLEERNRFEKMLGMDVIDAEFEPVERKQLLDAGSQEERNKAELPSTSDPAVTR